MSVGAGHGPGLVRGCPPGPAISDGPSAVVRQGSHSSVGLAVIIRWQADLYRIRASREGLRIKGFATSFIVFSWPDGSPVVDAAAVVYVDDGHGL